MESGETGRGSDGGERKRGGKWWTETCERECLGIQVVERRTQEMDCKESKLYRGWLAVFINFGVCEKSSSLLLQCGQRVKGEKSHRERRA